MINLKNIRQIFIICAASAMLGSCVAVSKSTTSKTLDIQASVIQKPTVADLEVKETKITGTSSGKIATMAVEAIQGEAVASALKTTNADILVEPRFETTVSGSTTTVTVSGFPATYKNFRPMKIDDIALVQSGVVRQVSTFVPPTISTLDQERTSAKKFLGGFLITIGTLGLLAALLIK